MELRDGDVVEVFTVADERRHRVVVTGAVHRPGTYEWSEGLTLHQLMDKALGLTEEAYTARAHVYRLVAEDGSRRVIQVPLVGDSAGAPGRDFLLADRDSIVIYSRAQLRNERFVSIDGFVKYPGHYPLAEGMTVRDLILAAGGFTEGADTRVAEIARLPDTSVRSDTTAVIFQVPLGGPGRETPSRRRRVGPMAGMGATFSRGLPIPRSSGCSRATGSSSARRSDTTCRGR